MVLGKQNVYMQKNAVRFLPYIYKVYTKVNSKWIRDLKVNAKTNKLIRKHREKASSIGFCNGF